jgi:hypothetical protein
MISVKGGLGWDEGGRRGKGCIWGVGRKVSYATCVWVCGCVCKVQQREYDSL